MKEGEIYKHKKGFLFRVSKVYSEPSVVMEILGHKDKVVDKSLFDSQIIDSEKTWKDMDMERIL